MRTFLSIIFALVISAASAQIMPADSSIQVIGYWSKNDVQTYNVVNKKYKVKGEQDTVDVETTKYQVDVKVLDSTATNYVIEWHYKNFDISGSNQFTKSISSIFKDMKVVIKTSDLGAFQEVVNWKEIRDEVKTAFVAIRQKYKNLADVDQVLKNVEEQMSSKAAIETYAILDILQFYTFHGGKYTLHDDIETNLVSNGIPGKPVDVLMTVQLSEINEGEDNAVLRVWKEFDKTQMTDATYEVMKNLTKSTKEKLPPRDEMPEISYSEYIGARVHGGSGWIIYSVQTKQTSTGGSTTVEEREIEIL
ncbi:MAG: hypothetical protein WDO14_08670 [Bacteroidota bacterium]